MYDVSASEYNDWLAHVGVDHTKGNPGSGRYEWGSGKHPYQRSGFSYDDYMDLVKEDADNRQILKKEGYLTRDPRMKERKKYGLKAARRAPQFSKR